MRADWLKALGGLRGIGIVFGWIGLLGAEQGPSYPPEPPVQIPPEAREPLNPPIRPPDAPTIHRRPKPEEAQAPFILTLEEQRQVDWVLQKWEALGKTVKTFECKVWRFEYDRVFGQEAGGGPPRPTHRDEGKIWYAAPDKGRFEIYGDRAEKWICDGKAIYEYNYTKKQVIQYNLPPELQGQAIADGPLPFLFGSTAADLRNRYWIRLTEPPPGVSGQIWLEAYPKFQKDRANFKRAEMILREEDLKPVALMLVLPNDNRVSYRFDDLKINAKNLLGEWFTSDPFRPTVPLGWQRVVEQSGPSSSARPSDVRPIR
ncbi:MAG: TIGR03009 domain-containing protein [Thermoguttaceae bacterium]|nr:TIGR03009 domain-containing protein [Thermoguttaceae bacterium]MDW8037729.1 TIGR03009 domain-containing protein [Thermoguttaceae bacterium]